MSDLSIKVNIAGRMYPLTVKAEEEETVRKAAKTINDHIKNLEENYAVKDKQDLLAMAALQYAQEVLEKKSGSAEDEKVLLQLKETDHRLSDYLSNAS